jgi:hypothetical protein
MADETETAPIITVFRLVGASALGIFLIYLSVGFVTLTYMLVTAMVNGTAFLSPVLLYPAALFFLLYAVCVFSNALVQSQRIREKLFERYPQIERYNERYMLLTLATVFNLLFPLFVVLIISMWLPF